jgi:YD repeat-containing protein
MFGLNWISTYEEILTGPDSNNYLTYWRGDGSSWTFSYNSVLGTYSMASPPNVRAQLVSNLNGGFTLTLADHTQRVFNAQNFLAAIIDRNNNQTTINYDNQYRITSVTSPGGKTLTFTYGDPNNIYQATAAQDSVGTVATYVYDSWGRLTSVTYADGSGMNFTHDPTSSMILSVTDKQGKLLESHTYDSSNRGLTSARAYGVASVSLIY